MSGGVLSLPFEAAQWRRSLENSVVAALVGGIALGEVWAAVARVSLARAWRVVVARRWQPACSPRRPAMNVNAYFVLQSRDAAVWGDMGVANEAIGRAIARYGAFRDVWVAREYADSPVVRFLAPGIPYEPWPGARALPAPRRGRTRRSHRAPPRIRAGGRAACKDVPGCGDRCRETAGRTGTRFTYMIGVPASEIAASRGVVARDRSDTLVKLERFGIDGRLDQPGGRGLDGLDAQGSGLRRVPVHVARARLPGRPRGRVEHRAWAAATRLAAGLHRLEARVAPRDRRQPGQVQWASVRAAVLSDSAKPVVRSRRRLRPQGLVGSYRLGRSLAGPVSELLVDPEIALKFHVPPVGPPFTVDWIGELYAPETGTYAFGIEQRDTATLTIDGRTIVDNRTPNELVERSMRLRRGWHDVRLRYRAVTGGFHVYLYWTPPGGERGIVRTEYLRPRGTGGWPGVVPSGQTVPDALDERLRKLSEEGELPALSGAGGG